MLVLVSWFFKSLIAQEDVWGLLRKQKEMRCNFGESQRSKRDQETLPTDPPTPPSTRLEMRERALWKHCDNLLTGPTLFYASIHLLILGAHFWVYSSHSSSHNQLLWLISRTYILPGSSVSGRQCFSKIVRISHIEKKVLISENDQEVCITQH